MEGGLEYQSGVWGCNSAGEAEVGGPNTGTPYMRMRMSA